MPSYETREKARRALWSYAFFRIESAITLAATIILTALAASNVPWLPGQWWMWLLAGLAAEAILVYSTVSDKNALRDTTNKTFNEQFDLSILRSKTLRDKVQKALEYRSAISQEIDRKDNKAVDKGLRDMTAELEGWIKQVYHLAQVLDVYTRDGVIARDLEQVPKELRVLEVKRNQETNPSIKQELQVTFENKAKQMDALTTIQNTMQKAQLQLENTLSALGTVYTQVLNLGAKELGSNEAQRLQGQMREQVQSLEDINSAMDEVYKLGS
jgi:hypothetical protein